MTDSESDVDEGTGIPDEVVLPVEQYIDLHAFAAKDVRAVVLSYLDAAIEAGFREVRLIHGRGRGVQRASLRALLADHPAVLAFDDAEPTRGGWGATVVRLRHIER